MRRILLLNLLANQDGRTVGFPKKFDSVPYFVSPSGEKTMLDRKTVEQAVLKCINKFNQTLNVDSIEYVAIKDQFPSVFVGACTGVIVEEEEIPSDESDECKANGKYVFVRNGSLFSRELFCYVFISPSEVGSRNAFVSQTIFPELFDYMGRYLPSPSYTIANKPIFFINIAYGSITPISILRNFAGLEQMGIQYLEAFGPSFNPIDDAPLDVRTFVNKYYDVGTDGKSDWFEIDFENKKFKILMDRFTTGENNYLELKKDGSVGFHGSTEKFFAINMLPVAMMANREGYDIDLEAFKEFCRNEGVLKFTDKDEKFPRMVTVYNYLEKLIKQRR